MKNYCFDYDSTLIDSSKVNVLSTQAAFRNVNWPVPDAATAQSYIGLPIEVSFPIMAPDDATDDQMQELYRVFMTEYNKLEQGNIKLFPGIKEVLQHLLAEGKRLFVVSSNHSAVITRQLKALGILGDFETVIGANKVKRSKPAPDGILKVLNDFDLKAADTIMIGDATFDIKMGKNAHVHTAGVTWGAHHPDDLKKDHPDYLFDKVSQLLTIK